MKKISFVFAIVTLCASFCACAGKGEFSLAENTAYTEENAPFTYEELIACENVIVDESLLLINQTHKIKDGDTFDITEYKDSGVLMNSCIHSAYAELSSDVKEKFSEKLYVMSAYRTKEEQLQAIAEEAKKPRALMKVSIGQDLHLMCMSNITQVRHFYRPIRVNMLIPNVISTVLSFVIRNTVRR